MRSVNLSHARNEMALFVHFRAMFHMRTTMVGYYYSLAMSLMCSSSNHLLCMIIILIRELLWYVIEVQNTFWENELVIFKICEPV